MIALVLLRLTGATVSVALAAALLARDHGLRANRLIAAFLLCNAWWALGELFLVQTSDVEVATRIYRSMSIGWIPLGVLCAHASVSLSAMDRHSLVRLLPFIYGAIVVVVPFGLFTDAVVVGAERSALGWRPLYGPGMVAAYLLVAAPLFGVLRSWRELKRRADSTGQRLLARIVFFGVSGALAVGTLTSVVLPVLRIDAIAITTELVATVGLAVAWTLRRFGYSLIGPEAFAREILDTLEDGVVLVGEDGRLRDANRAFLRMVGESPIAAIGRPIRSWIPDLPELGAMEEPPGSTLLRLERRLGGAWPVVLSAPVACRSGERLVGHALLVRDHREVVSLQRRLAVSARLAAVGDLALPIAQAISEPTARVREELEGLALDWGATRDVLELAGLDLECGEAIEEGRELIAECVEGADRITSIVREVAGFSSGGDRAEFVSHPLDRIVERGLRIAAVHAPADLEFDVRLEPGIRIPCHFAEIERVVTNLLVNAIHALAEKPVGARRVSVVVTGRGRRALVSVEDDGCGIDPEVIDRIFDPFFTTKPVGKGTGLGLAISYHIVKAHGGEIRVASEPGRGTRIAVDLPRASEAAGEGR